MPRIQQHLILRKAGGKTDLVREVLPDADLDQRIRDLKAVIPAGWGDDDPDAVRRLTLLCDGCGTRLTLDFDDPRKPDGWTERDDGDFCPACTEPAP